jgi:hypothetical protein
MVVSNSLPQRDKTCLGLSSPPMAASFWTVCRRTNACKPFMIDFVEKGGSCDAEISVIQSV